jgi:hypothetical protein
MISQEKAEALCSPWGEGFEALLKGALPEAKVERKPRIM